MQNIPRTYREVWASAMAKILGVIQSAEDGIELERGLKWFLILPKALFRQGRRGGKAGKGLVARRINMLVRGDWGRDRLVKLETGKVEKCKWRKTERMLYFSFLGPILAKLSGQLPVMALGTCLTLISYIRWKVNILIVAFLPLPQ